ncbi:MAG: hypothetical protein ACOYYF_18395 [Chloroflexota bacterium]|nr:hypothetical protein [Chloroflexota bacterium]MBI5702023.1 hypothetical protein [Chloroflexota bacterium]
MNILVLNFPGAERAALFSDERLENLRRLMDMGCFGALAASGEWNVLARQEHHTLTLMEYFQQADKLCVDTGDPLTLREKLSVGDWDYLQYTAASFPADNWSADDYLRLDHDLGEALQELSDDTVILILGRDCFVLVSANNPISGEYSGGSAADIAPTLVQLAGFPLPSLTEGKSWVQGMELNDSSGLTADEQQILRDRLSGLGYI